VVAPTIRDFHEVVVARLSPVAGRSWLDVACGTGDLASLAAAAGGFVKGADFSPVMIEAARENANRSGPRVQFDVAEALPYEDAAFDLASSTFGIMFAPHHERAAAELARWSRPAGESRLPRGLRKAATATSSA
jgi:ubiquinone/menaquinone biosynthesis C-methylase UbiE